MDYNTPVWFLAALIPMFTGFLWYHPAVFGTAWMRTAGLVDSDLQRGRMPVILGFVYGFSVLIAFMLTSVVVHQSGFFSLFAMEYAAGDETIVALVDDVLNTYGDKHRHFGHGALHGGIGAIALAIPVIAINALFERRSWKYSAIHAGYWFITLCLMGGVICQFI